MRRDVQSKDTGESRIAQPQPQKPEVLTAIAKAFTALADARERCRQELATDPRVFELAFDPGSFSLGAPLLAGVDPARFLDDFTAAAACLLPGMAGLFPAVSEELGELARAVARDEKTALRCLAALQSPQDKAGELWDSLAGAIGITAEVAAFGAREVFKVCLARLEPLLSAQIGDIAWYRGYCPICGSFPDLGYLTPKAPEPTEFLVSKSGEMHLHCGGCGHAWRYLRIKCPICETTDQDKFTSLTVGDTDEERVYICSECGRYFPCIDLTGGHPPVRFDTAALGLLHLEYVARSRGFSPAASQPWNVFA